MNALIPTAQLDDTATLFLQNGRWIFVPVGRPEKKRDGDNEVPGRFFSKDECVVDDYASVIDTGAWKSKTSDEMVRHASSGGIRALINYYPDVRSWRSINIRESPSVAAYSRILEHVASSEPNTHSVAVYYRIICNWGYSDPVLHADEDDDSDRAPSTADNTSKVQDFLQLVGNKPIFLAQDNSWKSYSEMVCISWEGCPPDFLGRCVSIRFQNVFDSAGPYPNSASIVIRDLKANLIRGYTALGIKRYTEISETVPEAGEGEESDVSKHREVANLCSIFQVMSRIIFDEAVDEHRNILKANFQKLKVRVSPTVKLATIFRDSQGKEVYKRVREGGALECYMIHDSKVPASTPLLLVSQTAIRAAALCDELSKLVPGNYGMVFATRCAAIAETEVKLGSSDSVLDKWIASQIKAHNLSPEQPWVVAGASSAEAAIVRLGIDFEVPAKPTKPAGQIYHPDTETRSRVGDGQGGFHKNYGSQYLVDFVDLKSKSNPGFWQVHVLTSPEVSALESAWQAKLDSKANVDVTKDTGYRGEFMFNEYLVNVKGKAGAFLNCTIADFEWLNEPSEQGKPYDFELTTAEREVMYVEVKSTSSTVMPLIEITSNEIAFAREKGPHYVLCRVSGLETTPSLTAVKDPVRCLQIYVGMSHRSQP